MTHTYVGGGRRAAQTTERSQDNTTSGPDPTWESGEWLYAPETRISESSGKPASEIVEQDIEVLRRQRETMLGSLAAAGRKGLTDAQLLVCRQLLASPDGRIHVYEIAKDLKEAGTPLSEKGVTNALVRLSELGLVAKDPALVPNPRGPVRQFYQLLDPVLASRIVEAEDAARDAYERHLTAPLSLTS